MGALKTFGMAAALLAASPAQTDPVERWRPLIAEASQRFGIPQAWIVRVMRAESGGHTMLGGRPITSRAGAMGLMQLIPGTWAQMRRAHGLGSDPHDPRDNVIAGVAYLRVMHDRFGYPGLFAAYNAGPARYQAHLHKGRTLPSETLTYLAKVAPGIPTAGAIASGAPPAAGIFFSLEGVPDPAAAPAATQGRGRLFVALRPAPSTEE